MRLLGPLAAAVIALGSLTDIVFHRAPAKEPQDELRALKAGKGIEQDPDAIVLLQLAGIRTEEPSTRITPLVKMIQR